MPDATEDRFLGCLLGLAIGDALGMPIGGYSPARIAAELGTIDRYHGRTFADETEIKAGEFTDETEIALCIVESLTTNDGEIDVENIGSRLLYLARGESKRWMSADTLAALEAADRTLQFAVPIDEDGPATGEVAARGVPIGLFHAVGDVAPDRLRRDAEAVVRLTHGSPAATAAALPPELPPGVRPFAHGLCTGPYALFSFDEPIANSSMFVLPSTRAPASRSRVTAVASYIGTWPSRIFEPAVVSTPSVQKMSLTAIGAPRSPRSAAPSSMGISSAAFQRKALSSSPSAAPRYARQYSSEEISP